MDLYSVILSLTVSSLTVFNSRHLVSSGQPPFPLAAERCALRSLLFEQRFCQNAPSAAKALLHLGDA